MTSFQDSYDSWIIRWIWGQWEATFIEQFPDSSFRCDQTYCVPSSRSCWKDLLASSLITDLSRHSCDISPHHAMGWWPMGWILLPRIHSSITSFKSILMAYYWRYSCEIMRWGCMYACLMKHARTVPAPLLSHDSQVNWLTLNTVFSRGNWADSSAYCQSPSSFSTSTDLQTYSLTGLQASPTKWTRWYWLLIITFTFSRRLCLFFDGIPSSQPVLVASYNMQGMDW